MCVRSVVCSMSVAVVAHVLLLTMVMGPNWTCAAWLLVFETHRSTHECSRMSMLKTKTTRTKRWKTAINDDNEEISNFRILYFDSGMKGKGISLRFIVWYDYYYCFPKWRFYLPTILSFPRQFMCCSGNVNPKRNYKLNEQMFSLDSVSIWFYLLVLCVVVCRFIWTQLHQFVIVLSEDKNSFDLDK